MDIMEIYSYMIPQIYVLMRESNINICAKSQNITQICIHYLVVQMVRQVLRVQFHREYPVVPVVQVVRFHRGCLGVLEVQVHHVRPVHRFHHVLLGFQWVPGVLVGQCHLLVLLIDWGKIII